MGLWVEQRSEPSVEREVAHSEQPEQTEPPEQSQTTRATRTLGTDQPISGFRTESFNPHPSLPLGKGGGSPLVHQYSGSPHNPFAHSPIHLFTYSPTHPFPQTTRATRTLGT
ncbi:MAG TPA: hypothetical protein VJ835_05615, partial [Fimbriimonadaceae bacterium]|nr:hypothetical protein [Fimbriimonadaceae bacterium]